MRYLIVVGLLILTSCNWPTSSSSPGQPRTNPLFNRGPARESWTILCREFDQPQHRSLCEQIAVTLRRVPDIRGADVACQTDESRGVTRLVYGTYERQVDPSTQQRSTPPNLQHDLALIRDLGDDRGQPFFSGARMAPVIDTVSGPDQWDLSSAPRGVYSLQIAVFFPELEFSEPRRAAIEFVTHLREEGHEAFYHHDRNRSIVTVGLFDESAARVDPTTGRTTLSTEVKALQRNPLFQFNYENGQKRTKIVNGQRFPPYSFLVRIPGAADVGHRLLVATTNPGKLREIAALLEEVSVEVLRIDDTAGWPAPIEDCPTFAGNARKKARYYARLSGHVTLADDSGLEVDALGGRPGVFSARFAGPACNAAANNAELIRQLRTTPPQRWTARFRCAIAVATPTGAVLEAEGTLEGRIIDPPRGREGFGYDPHFLVPAFDRTLAELRPEHKNRISHRGAALGDLAARLGAWLSGVAGG